MKSFALIFFLLTGISMNAFAEKIWIDVRTAEEYAKGHVAGALLMPHDQIAVLIADKVSDKTAQLQLYCGTGRRADIARATLLQMGYTHIENHGSVENAMTVADESNKQNSHSGE